MIIHSVNCINLSKCFNLYIAWYLFLRSIKFKKMNGIKYLMSVRHIAIYAPKSPYGVLPMNI